MRTGARCGISMLNVELGIRLLGGIVRFTVLYIGKVGCSGRGCTHLTCLRHASR
jgi:hypothetical protein